MFVVYIKIFISLALILLLWIPWLKEEDTGAKASKILNSKSAFFSRRKGGQYMNWIRVAQVKDQFSSLVNAVLFT